MSRSRKKTPCCNVVKPDGSWKAIYNRKIRRSAGLDVPSGNYYRKMNESYNIHDWREVYVSFETFSKPLSPYSSPEHLTRDKYERYYIRK